MPTLAEPPSIAQQANILLAVLSEWAEARGGYAKVLANIRHLWEELTVLGDRPRILIVLAGEVARSSQALDRNYRVDRNWHVAVVRGHGFKHGMEEDIGDAPAFYQDVEAIRDRVRVILTISEEFPVDYRGMEPLPSLMKTELQSAFGDGYLLKFSTANDIPQITLVAPGTETLSGTELPP